MTRRIGDYGEEATVQWTEGGPEFPISVTEELEDGNLVLFCGAGISIPAGLPCFKGLVERVYSSLPDQPENVRDVIRQGQYDRALYALEEVCGRITVRKRIPKILTLAPHADLSTHEAILALAKNGDGKLRLVTTNFDVGFEQSALKPRIDCAPRLPIPKKERWNSLVYLHGRLDESDPDCENLILSSADFGLAYLTERWASRFVTELFRRFTVLFIGYSVDDPVMRYMMDAFAADRAIGESVTKAYALVGSEEKEMEPTAKEWRQKGLEPIVYVTEGGSHEKLHASLKAWADLHRLGLQGKDAIIYQNAYRPLFPSAAKQVCWALSDKSGTPAKIFANLSPPPPVEWLGILEDAGLLGIPRNPDADVPARLFSASGPPADPDFHGTTRHLIGWLMTHLDKETLVRWVIQKGGYLDRYSRSCIRARLEVTGRQLSNGLRRFWELVSSEHFSSSLRVATYVVNIPGLIQSSSWSPSIRAELIASLSPGLRLSSPWPSLDGSEKEDTRLSRFAECQISLLCGKEVGQIWSVIDHHSERETILLDIADDLTSQLKRVCDLSELVERAGERYDYSYIHRPSIDDHPQNQDHDSWTLLISMLREAFLVADRIQPATARCLIDRWKTIRFPLFVRFVLFAAIKTNLLSTHESLELLAEADAHWLWSHFVQRETFQLLEKIWPTLGNEDSDRLIQLIMTGPARALSRPDIDEERLELLKRQLITERLRLLARTGRALPLIANGYGVDTPAREEVAIQRSTDRSHFPSWIEAGWGDPTLQLVDPEYNLREVDDGLARDMVKTYLTHP